MKSHITVIIDGKVDRIEKAVKNQLEKFCIDEENTETTRKHQWDYWTYYTEEDIGDAEIKQNFPAEPKEILCNSFYVKNLPNDYMTSGVIDLDGNWIDIQDFGW